MPGDDHDRQRQAAAGQLLLDIEAVHAGHVKIQHDAIRNLRGERVEEIPPRREGIRIQVRCPKEPLQSLSHRLVIIDDGDAESRSVHAAPSIADRARPWILDHGLTADWLTLAATSAAAYPAYASPGSP